LPQPKDEAVVRRIVKAYILLKQALPKEITDLKSFVVPGNATSVRSEPATPRTQTTLQQRLSPKEWDLVSGECTQDFLLLCSKDKFLFRAHAPHRGKVVRGSTGII
jgi:hypothetical protein